MAVISNYIDLSRLSKQVKQRFCNRRPDLPDNDGTSTRKRRGVL